MPKQPKKCQNPECEYPACGDPEISQDFCCEKCEARFNGEEWAIEAKKKHTAYCTSKQPGVQEKAWAPKPQKHVPLHKKLAVKCANPECEWPANLDPEVSQGYCCEKCEARSNGEEWAMSDSKKSKKHTAMCTSKDPEIQEAVWTEQNKYEPEIEAKLDQWVELKKAKDYEAADALREEIREMGVEPNKARKKPKFQKGGAKGGGKAMWTGPMPCGNPECTYMAHSDPEVCAGFCCEKCEAVANGEEWAQTGKQHYKTCERIEQSEGMAKAGGKGMWGGDPWAMMEAWAYGGKAKGKGKGKEDPWGMAKGMGKGKADPWAMAEDPWGKASAKGMEDPWGMGKAAGKGMSKAAGKGKAAAAADPWGAAEDPWGAAGGKGAVKAAAGKGKAAAPAAGKGAAAAPAAVRKPVAKKAAADPWGAAAEDPWGAAAAADPWAAAEDPWGADPWGADPWGMGMGKAMGKGMGKWGPY